MARTHWRRLLTPTWLLIGATLSAFDCALGVGPVGQGPAETNPPPPPPHPPIGSAVRIEVRPNLAFGVGATFGTIREGSYVDSLTLHGHILGDTSVVAMILEAGHGRPGTYRVTVDAPGYVTWDTAGVVAGIGADSIVRTVELSVQLVETP